MMPEQLIECLGCHRGNTPESTFCAYCRRRLRIPEGWDPGIAAAAAEPVKPSRPGWFRRRARPAQPIESESQLVTQRLRRYAGPR